MALTPTLTQHQLLEDINLSKNELKELTTLIFALIFAPKEKGKELAENGRRPPFFSTTRGDVLPQ